MLGSFEFWFGSGFGWRLDFGSSSRWKMACVSIGIISTLPFSFSRATGMTHNENQSIIATPTRKVQLQRSQSASWPAAVMTVQLSLLRGRQPLGVNVSVANLVLSLSVFLWSHNVNSSVSLVYLQSREAQYKDTTAPSRLKEPITRGDGRVLVGLSFVYLSVVASIHLAQWPSHWAIVSILSVRWRSWWLLCSCLVSLNGIRDPPSDSFVPAEQRPLGRRSCQNVASNLP